MLQLAVLLVLDGVFYFLVIPAGIVDPDGFGVDDGLPPSFAARLVAVLLAGLMLVRLARMLGGGDRDDDAVSGAPNPEAGGEPVRISLRSVAGMGAALLFAGVAMPQLGFLLGGAVFLAVLLAVMGERRPTRLVVYPALVMFLVWLLFEQLLSIRLPVGLLFAE
jgi:hypothetical protein